MGPFAGDRECCASAATTAGLLRARPAEAPSVTPRTPPTRELKAIAAAIWRSSIPLTNSARRRASSSRSPIGSSTTVRHDPARAVRRGRLPAADRVRQRREPARSRAARLASTSSPVRAALGGGSHCGIASQLLVESTLASACRRPARRRRRRAACCGCWSRWRRMAHRGSTQSGRSRRAAVRLRRRGGVWRRLRRLPRHAGVRRAAASTSWSADDRPARRRDRTACGAGLMVAEVALALDAAHRRRPDDPHRAPAHAGRHRIPRRIIC